MTQSVKFGPDSHEEHVQLGDDLFLIDESNSYSVRNVEPNRLIGNDNIHPENLAYQVENSHHSVDAHDRGTHYTEQRHDMDYSEPNYPVSTSEFSQTTEKEFKSGKRISTAVHSQGKYGYIKSKDGFISPSYGEEKIIRHATRTISHPDGTTETRTYTGSKAERMERAAQRLSGIYAKRRQEARDEHKKAA